MGLMGKKSCIFSEMDKKTWICWYTKEMRLAKNSDVLIHLSSHHDVGDLDISIHDFVPNNNVI